MFNRPMRIILSLSLLLFVVSHSIAQNEATAEYSVTFTGNWTTQSTPGGVVSSAHFTTLAIATHNSSVVFWESGGTATAGLEQLAELGATSTFLSEVRASTHSDVATTSSVGSGGTGTSTFTLNVKRSHPLFTFASMIGPSPDWFVGLNSRSLLDGSDQWVSSLSLDLYAYDAGTEDGTEFRLSNPATVPQGVITSLRGVGKFSNVRMARIVFTRQNVQPPVTTTPVISSIKRADNAPEITNADEVAWLVGFSEQVRNVSAADFEATGTSARVVSATPVAGASQQYRITLRGGDLASLNGRVELGLSSQQDIENVTGVKLATTIPTTNETYFIDNLAPIVSSISPLNATGSPFTVSFEFSEFLASGTFADLGDVKSSEATVTAPIQRGTLYEITVTPNDPTNPGTITLHVDAGAAMDIAGNLSEAFSGDVFYEPRAIEPVDPVMVLRVSAITPDGTYKDGDTIEIGVIFSEAVTVIGIPMLNLQFDARVRRAGYTKGSGTDTLSFEYTIQQGDSTQDLDYANVDALDSAGASIVGLTGVSANLDLPIPGSAGSLSQSSDIAVEETTEEGGQMPTFGNIQIQHLVFMVDTPIASFQFPSATGGDGELTYSIEPTLPSGLMLDLGSITLSGTPTEILPPTEFIWTVTDQDGDADSLKFLITVNADLKPVFATDAFETEKIFIENSPIDSFTLPNAMGGDGTLKYRLSPQLPRGLRLDVVNNAVSGTPLEPKSETKYEWHAEDEDGDVAVLEFSITVVEDLEPEFDDVVVVADQEYIQYFAINEFMLPSAAGGNGTLTYSLTPDLPDGLSLDLDSRRVSGTPQEPTEVTTYVWRVMDADGDEASIAFDIVVHKDLRPTFQSDVAVEDREFIQNSPIDPFMLPSAQGGNGTLTYSLTPDLLDGLSLDLDSRRVSGTPQQPTEVTTYVWRAMDADGDVAVLEFSITVVEDLEPEFDDAVAVADQEYIQYFAINEFMLPSAAGGNGTLTYSLTPDLPDGLSLDLDSRRVSGTPQEPTEVTTYVWRVMDADGDEASIAFDIVVHKDLQPTFESDVAVEDREFIQNSPIDPFMLPSAQGGNGTLTYSLTPDLPAGLSLDIGSREISGLPEQPMSTTTFSWIVVDFDGDEDVVDFKLTVVADVQPEFAIVELDQVYLQNEPIEPLRLPVAEGGNGDLTYQFTPAPPRGLIFDAMSRTISGTPSDWQQRTQYEWSVTDQDGDSASISVYITVIEDLVPAFAESSHVPDQTFIAGSSIEPVLLPLGEGGNGSLRHRLEPDLPAGLALDVNAQQISGTPTTPIPQTSFRWTVLDSDDDSSTIQFHITVLQDLQPEFRTQIPDQSFVIDTPIDPVILPTAMSGNGELSYSLAPDLPTGLVLDSNMREISGTPTELMDSMTFSWTVEDIDGDVAEITFEMEVLPMPPMLVGLISPRILYVGGSTDTVDARSVVSGDVDSWSFVAENGNDVVALSSSQPGRVVLRPLMEGSTSVSVTASNVSGTVSVDFLVTVTTDVAESDQIDIALAHKARAMLSSTLNVFERRFLLTRSGSSQTFAKFHSQGSVAYSGPIPNSCNFCKRRTRQARPSPLLSYVPKLANRKAQSTGFQPNFSHDAEKWSVWGSFDSQSFSSGTSGNEVDGSLVSQYLGGDWGVSDNLYAGVAVARHSSDTDYVFASELATGEGSFELSLTSVYPYVQARNGSNLSFYLVAGVSNGEATLNRVHASSPGVNSDAEASLFAGGFEFLVLQAAGIDLSIVGNAGSSTLTLTDDVGLLANRETSSGKTSLGGDLSFVQDLEEGAFVTSLGLRAMNESGDGETGTGLEANGSIGYWGEKVDLFFSGKVVAAHSGDEVKRNSLTARVRYKAATDGTGLSVSVSPSFGIDETQRIGPLRGKFSAARPGHNPFTLSSSSLEYEVSYGLRMGDRSVLVTPGLVYQELGNDFQQTTFDVQISPNCEDARWDFRVQGTRSKRYGKGLGVNMSLVL